MNAPRQPIPYTPCRIRSCVTILEARVAASYLTFTTPLSRAVHARSASCTASPAPSARCSPAHFSEIPATAPLRDGSISEDKIHLGGRLDCRTGASFESAVLFGAGRLAHPDDSHTGSVSSRVYSDGSMN
ncbi:hypothetical protein EVAR_50431_1 [Eumeta japonica]|uniref:Uncharacterized protein n=1 Tax=Eumeta variegata TaxID=151549 RepID=A0A4C1XRM8_EUMVA|nr:hypothetical protein EVAR_50431_1 [Eumeta japonica]